MAKVKSKCPNCGEISEIESSEFNVVCRFCGVPFMPKEGVDSYNNYIANNINIDTVNVNAENISSYAMLGIASLQEKNAEKCGFYADDILKRDAFNVDGLLLKAYFVNNNYSKEDAMKYYFLAFDNCYNQEKFELIQRTFFESILDYSLENFSYFFKTVLSKDMSKFFGLLCYGISVYFSYFDEAISINEVKLNYLDFVKIINRKETLVKNVGEGQLILIDDLLLLVKEDNIINGISLSFVDKEIDKYLNKKQIYKYTYYFSLENNVVGFNFVDDNSELEALLIDKGLSINLVKSGCYVATCVYGDYYSNEVCVLRRYRDFKLQKSLFGRLFIKTYYFISPFFVKWFGKTKWFNSLNRKVLDRIVALLKKKGYEDSFYRD